MGEWGIIVRKHNPGTSAKVERAKQVQNMLNQQMDVIDIAEEFGITKNAVYKIIQAYGLRFPK